MKQLAVAGWSVFESHLKGNRGVYQGVMSLVPSKNLSTFRYSLNDSTQWTDNDRPRMQWILDRVYPPLKQPLKRR